MKKSMMLALALFALGTASATGTTPSHEPITVNAKIDVLIQLIASGATVELVKDGTVIATVNADGTITLADGKTLEDATAIRVTTADGAAPSTYVLASPLDKPGQLKVEAVNVQDKAQRLPLVAVLNRHAEAAHAANAERKAQARPELPAQAPQQAHEAREREQPEQAPERAESGEPAAKANGKGRGK